MNMKKLLSALLVLALLLSVLPMTALAKPQVFYLEKHTVQKARSGSADFVPPLASGNHERFIDRLASLPDYALDFYSWLESNTGAFGVLAMPEKGTLNSNGNGYYHLVNKFKGSEQFTYTRESEIFSTASQIATVAMGEELDYFSAYTGAVWDAFRRDHPEVFWLTGWTAHGYMGGWSYSVSGNVVTVTYEADMVTWLMKEDFDIRETKYQDSYAVATAMDTRDLAIEEILAGCPGGTAYEQVVYLNDTLTANNAYNSTVAGGVTAGVDTDAWACISALEGRAGKKGPVCEGYAKAFKVLCDQLQIPCVLVDGDAKSSLNGQPGGHMWNYVRLNGRWYAVDVTWNDPYVSSSPSQKKSGYENHDWLLLGSNTMVATGLNYITSHPVSNSLRTDGPSFINGPKLERDAYDPNAVPKYTVSGTVTSFGDETVTVELWRGNTLQAERRLSGNSVFYSFENLPEDTYRLMVKKPDHVTWTQELSLTDQVVTQNVKLHRLGDMTGDGRINVGDAARVYAHVRGTTVITDAYLLLCADVKSDGRINVGDVAMLYSQVRS